MTVLAWDAECEQELAAFVEQRRLTLEKGAVVCEPQRVAYLARLDSVIAGLRARKAATA